MKPRTKQVEPTFYVGCDVAKRSFQAAIARPDQKCGVTSMRDLPTKKFPRAVDGIHSMMTWVDKELRDELNGAPVHVVMESTGKYSVELAEWIYQTYPQLSPAIVNAIRTHNFIKSTGLRGKTDAIDARALAFYGLERVPAPYQPLGTEQRELRALVRHRNDLVQEQIALSNREKEDSGCKFVNKAQKRIVGILGREITKTEKQMRTLVQKNPQLKQDIALLTTIHGVGFLTAVTVLAEMGDLRRFERARQLSAFAGLNPRLRESGETKKPTRLDKLGNSHVRKALYMSSLTAIGDKSDMQRVYEMQCAKGKPKMVAIGAVMRKLLVLMRAILISGKPYDPMWKTQSKNRLKACVA